MCVYHVCVWSLQDSDSEHDSESGDYYDSEDDYAERQDDDYGSDEADAAEISTRAPSMTNSAAMSCLTLEDQGEHAARIQRTNGSALVFGTSSLWTHA